jgi:hypothetical protein
MNNNDILIKFHEMNYEEQLHLVLQRDHFRNADLVPLAQQFGHAVAKVADSAQQALCRYEVLRGTVLCSEPSI